MSKKTPVPADRDAILRESERLVAAEIRRLEVAKQMHEEILAHVRAQLAIKELTAPDRHGR
jgi:hypothetical protein